eukprot:TRINITY_DN15573_c0_g1_i3.p1 TRINITY_DN15573_c0_g1~~TRINITY_DN15573_c0_g1_i3.p1  ORF type:complete len:870 (+),score=124.73 TRINITY_DN15573_c0_g1_i3:63-2612(+)
MPAKPSQADATEASKSNGEVGRSEGSPMTAAATNPMLLGATKTVRRLASQVGVEIVKEADWKQGRGVLQGLNKATFSDHRWDQAMAYLQTHDILRSDKDAKALLLQGAKAFGLWDLSDEAIASLIPHVRDANVMSLQSPGLTQYLQTLERKHVHFGSLASDGGQFKPRSSLRARTRLSRATTDEVNEDAEMTDKDEGWSSMLDHSTLFWSKRVFTTLVILLCIAYAIYLFVNTRSALLPLFSWSVYVARGAGLGAAILSGFMYLSMARTVMKVCFAMLPAGNCFLAVLDCHKDMHIFAGKGLVLASVIHTIAHLVGPVEGLASHTPEELNKVLFCAQPGGQATWLKWMNYPACPFDRKLTYLEVLYKTLPGITGIILSVLLFVLAYTSRHAARAKNFDMFWYCHNLGLVAWPIVLFTHGSNQWLGMGVPIALWTVALPLAFYALDRVGRLLRYVLFTGRSVRIVEAVVREGKKGGVNGALVHLEVSKPPYLWNFRAGMYAFICLPEYAPFQWHPFTISSGKNDPNVEFLIAAVGDWTKALAQRCIDVRDKGAAMPRIALDGPYPAPTQTAMAQEVLVAVGAGVGVTPFLSLLATIVAILEDEETVDTVDLKVAHFFWLTRSMDELLFGRRHFAKIAALPRLRDHICLHLHCTGREPDSDGAAFLFRQAVKRQSVHDRDAFRDALIQHGGKAQPGVSLPWCWLNGSKQDVVWIDGLTNTLSDTPLLHGVKSDDGIAVTAMTSCEGGERGADKTASPSQGSLHVELGSEKSHSSAVAAIADIPKGQSMLPVAFGRPDFKTEVAAIGRAWPEQDVHVYVCGNDQLIASLKDVCKACNHESSQHIKRSKTPTQ